MARRVTAARWLALVVSVAPACSAQPPSAQEPEKAPLEYDDLLALPGERAVLHKRGEGGAVVWLGVAADRRLLWTHESNVRPLRFDERWLYAEDHLVDAGSGRVVRLASHSGRLLVVDDFIYELTETGVAARPLEADAAVGWNASTGFELRSLGVVGRWLVVGDHQDGEHRMAAVSLDDGEVRAIERDGWWVGRDDESVFLLGDDELLRVSVPDGALLGRLPVPVLVDEGNGSQAPRPHPIGAFGGDTLWYVPAEDEGLIVRWSGNGPDARWRVTVPSGGVPRFVHRPVVWAAQTASAHAPDLPPTTCWAIGREHPSLDGLYRSRLTCVDLRGGEVTWTSPVLEGRPLVRHDATGTLVVLHGWDGDAAIAVRLEREPLRAWDIGGKRAAALDGLLWLYDWAGWQSTSATLDELPENVRVMPPAEALSELVAPHGS